LTTELHNSFSFIRLTDRFLFVVSGQRQKFMENVIRSLQWLAILQSQHCVADINGVFHPAIDALFLLAPLLGYQVKRIGDALVSVCVRALGLTMQCTAEVSVFQVCRFIINSQPLVPSITRVRLNKQMRH
jgi:hypothetical protein